MVEICRQTGCKNKIEDSSTQQISRYSLLDLQLVFGSYDCISSLGQYILPICSDNFVIAAMIPSCNESDA